MVLTFVSVDETLTCNVTFHRSIESYRAIICCGAFYYVAKVALNLESVNEFLKCDHSNESY